MGLEPGRPESVEPGILGIGLKVCGELFLTPIPEKASSSYRCNGQQTDTENANKASRVGVSGHNLTIRSRGNFRARSVSPICYERFCAL